jgi:hypothetical protein
MRIPLLGLFAYSSSRPLLLTQIFSQIPSVVVENLVTENRGKVNQFTVYMRHEDIDP